MGTLMENEHCIGCGANPLWCRAHHIIWWSKNGPTDVDNLVLVCDDCHHKIHDHGWQVYKHPETGKYKLKPPNPAEKPNATQTPQHRATQPTSGETGPIGEGNADESRIRGGTSNLGSWG